MHTRAAGRLALPLALFAFSFVAVFGPPAASAKPPRAPRPGTVRVVSPPYRALVTGRRLTLRLAVGTGVSHLGVSVAGHSAHLRKARSGGLRTATISTKRLPAGPVRVAVTGRRHGHPISLTHQVVIGRHEPRLLGAVRLARRAVGEAHLHVRLGGRVTDFRVSVNGRRARLLEMPAQPVPSRRAVVLRRRGHRIKRAKRAPVPASMIPLSADDGLHPGRNRVVVLAYREADGSWARAVRNVWVSRQAPLVAAGQDRRVVAGSTPRLDGSNTLPASGTQGLDYNWQIVAQPKAPGPAARAQLLDRHSVRPRLVTHRPGTYKVALRAGPPHAGDDVVTLQAGASIPPYGVRIATNQEGALESGCGNPEEECWTHRTKTTIEGVELNGEGGDSAEAGFEDVLLVVLNRTNLTKSSVQIFQPSEVAAALAAAEAVKSSELAILSANARSPESEGREEKGESGKGGGGQGGGESQEEWEQEVERIRQKEEEEQGSGSGGGGGRPKEKWEEEAEQLEREEVERYGASLTAAAAQGKVEIPFGAPFSVVFSGGEVLASNIGRSIGGRPGALDGILREQNGTDGYFTFDFPETVEFDTYVEHGEEIEMEVGGKTYPMAKSSAKGIAIEALNARLESNPSLSGFFALTGSSGDEATLESVAARLKQIAEAEPGTVLMLQTIGDPKAERPAWGMVGAALESFGGTPTVWDELNGEGNYALVGAAYPGQETAATRASATVEASGPMEGGEAGEALKPWVGTTRGVLGRGPNGFPVIRASTSLPRTVIKVTAKEAREDEEEEKTGEVNETEVNSGEGKEEVQIVFSPFELMTLAEAAPEPWPLSNHGHEAALEYISQKLHLGDGREDENGDAPGWCFDPKGWDVRAEYCNTSIAGEWGKEAGDLKELGYSPNEEFTATEFNEVIQQLKKEFGDIEDVHRLFETLREPFQGTSGGLAGVFTRGAEKVEKDVLTPEAQELAEKEAVQVFTALLTPAQDAASGGLSVFFGVLESGMNLALDYAESKEGAPAAGPLNAETSEHVVTEAEDRIKDAMRGIGTLEEIVLTDWGKLSAVHARAKKAAWSTKAKTIDGIEESLETGAKAWFYETIMSASYGQIQVAPEGSVDLGSLQSIICNRLEAGVTRHAAGVGETPPEATWFPFENATEGDIFRPAVGVSAAGEPVRANYLWLVANLQSKEAEVPTPAITGPLFQSVRKGGIGLYRAPFFTWDFVGSRHTLPEYTERKIKGLGEPEACVEN
jgi:hypothetical protein